MTNIGVAEYQKIRRYVMNLILRSGGKSVQIPTIQELSEKFGVSRTTVSKAMKVLTEGLRYSRHAILREVVENEFAGEVPGEKCEAFTQKLLPLVGNVFSIYDLSDDNFALSPEYDLLYTELTGAVILYIEEYGV